LFFKSLCVSKGNATVHSREYYAFDASDAIEKWGHSGRNNVLQPQVAPSGLSPKSKNESFC